MLESVMVAAVLVAGPSEPMYRNPTKPTHNASKLLDSGYRGWHYEAEWEPFRKCVMARESGGNYKADGRFGSGAYQFVQASWDTAMRRADMPEWVGVRPYLAPPAVQDEAFWIMANPQPKKKGLHGAFHWSSKWAETIGKKVSSCR